MILYRPISFANAHRGAFAYSVSSSPLRVHLVAPRRWRSTPSISTGPPTSTMMNSSEERIKTRFLIISDTHGVKPKRQNPPENASSDEMEPGWPSDLFDHVTGFREPLQAADVALHCGDLTMKGYTHQFKATFDMMRTVPAPLKLVIAGNHDLLLDDEYWGRHGDQDARYKRPEMWRIIKDAEADGVMYLKEGTHTFDLANGARLTVYASPFTPPYGDWAFQCWEGHRFEIPRQVDIAMTHGPPHHVLDRCKDGTRAGSAQLLAALRYARPKVHCFGHIHESWGAMLAKWTEPSKLGGTAGNIFDGAASKVILKNAAYGSALLLDGSGSQVSQDEHARLVKHGAVVVDTTEGDFALKEGEQTLFVNASIMNLRYRPNQLPWLIDIELDSSPIDT